ncbi:alpha/beta fold hydrolase [Roseiflexus sp.]|uniref:alpha/beta fold hydrolase n=1 Tax=Roseiflexus sp. TaxID=2562120 RepID=UPI0021DDFF50|nr:alpha/beta hydrolase [Roseiflexus sp.]GIW01581.1 MAG: hypothetical protein KatS3mg058_2984 [Roseiflexus sp.]
MFRPAPLERERGIERQRREHAQIVSTALGRESSIGFGAAAVIAPEAPKKENVGTRHKRRIDGTTIRTALSSEAANRGQEAKQRFTHTGMQMLTIGDRQYKFHHIQPGNVPLAYIECGHGAPVVFVHGSGPTDLRTWERQIEPFAAHFRVVAYSRRCHYPNPATGDLAGITSTRTHARDLADLITALGLGRVHLVGFSFGADIVLRLAADRPDLVRTLTITEPPLRSWLATLPGGAELLTQRAAAILPAKRAVQDGNLEQGARLFIDGMMGRGVFDGLSPSARQRIVSNAHLIGAEPTEIDAVSAEDITRDEAATIQAPTLLLTGDASPPMFLIVSRELARILPNVEQARISGAAHLLHITHAQVYNAIVLGFLSKG